MQTVYGAQQWLIVPMSYFLVGIPPNIQTQIIPSVAKAAGYNTLTFGPQLLFGTNWYQHNFYNNNISPYTQNSDGSIFLPGGVAGYNGLCTAYKVSSGVWKGTCFGGGAYFEALISFPSTATPGSNWPSFWSQDIELMSYAAVTPTTQWPGQASNYGIWVETDFFELDTGVATTYGTQLHSWYGLDGGGLGVSLVGGSGNSVLPQNFSTPNRIGFLWIPATASTQGTGQWFFNGVQQGPTVYWNQYNAATQATYSPPPVIATPGNLSLRGDAGSILDVRHLPLIVNTCPTCPMLVQSVSVWQASAANNLVQ